ncbi:MAG: hydroxyacid dehydrogenase [Pseudomonadota bacterium]
MAEIVVTEFMDEAAVARLSAAHETLYDPSLADRPDEIPARLAEARALIVRNRTQVRGPVLKDAGALVAVGRLGVGLDNIDVAACRARGVEVFPATGANDASVAEYVIATALMLLRGAYLSTAAVASGEWPRQALIGREAGGRVMGLWGYGGIGRETARRAAALGLEVIAHDPFLPEGDARWAGAAPVDAATLLARSDVLSLHVPLTDATRGMIDAAALAAMKPGAVLINAARGGVVDESALGAALRDGRLGGAALDVFEAEPLTAEAARPLAGAPNLILTPHIAGVTEESNVRVSHMIAERILDALA